MSRTISYKRSHRSPPGDTRKLCSYCGIAWYRSQLFRDAAGNLVCPDDARGRDVVTLSEGNAQALANKRNMSYPAMPSDGTVDSPSTDSAPPFNWNGFTPAQPNGGPTGPLSVPIVGWWRADTVLIQTGRFVYAWPDKSGFGNVLSAIGTVLPFQQGNSTIGQQVLTFNGAGPHMYTNTRLQAPLWAWFIFEQVNWSAGATFFNGGCSITQQNAPPILRTQTTGTDNAGAPLLSWVRGMVNYTVAGTDDLRLGSTAVSSAAGGVRLNGSFNLCASSPGSVGAFNCNIAEFLLTVGQPSAAEIAQIEAYGQARYTGVSF